MVKKTSRASHAQTHVAMTGVAWWTCALLAVASARIYERCELAHELQRLGVAREHIPTWVCIAYHESRLDTAAHNPVSGDHGLLQISELFWCGPGKACGVPCDAFRDDDIADDVECALQIYEEHTRLQGDGFLAWVVYPLYCKHTTKKYLAECDNYVKNTTLKSEDKPSARAFSNTNFSFTQNPKIDELKPPYLAISSLLRDRQRYNSIPTKRDWVNYKFDNIDELRLPVFGTSFSTPASVITSPATTMTTYKPPVPVTNRPTTRFIFTTPATVEATTRSSYPTTTSKPTTRFTFATSPATSKPTTRSYSQSTTPQPLQTFTTSRSTPRPTFKSTTPATVTLTTPAIFKTTRASFTTPTVSSTTPATFRSTTPPIFSTTKRSYYTLAPLQVTTLKARGLALPETPFRRIETNQLKSKVKTTTSAPSTTTFSTLPPFTTSKYRVSTGYFTTQRPLSFGILTSTTARPIHTFKSFTTPKPFPQMTTKAERIYDFIDQEKKTTLSIFDLYLKPTRRPKLLPFSVHTINSPYKLSIFSGGTTAAPTANTGDAKTPTGGASRNHFRRQISTSE